MSFTTVSLKGGETTPSLLYNNLTSLDNWVAYVHKNDAVVVNVSRHDAPVIVHPLQSAEGKMKATVYQVKAIDINGVPTLLIVTQNGVLFWDMAKERHMGSCIIEDDKEIFLSRGLAVVPQGGSSLVFLGHSNGAISVISYESGQASVIKTLVKHTDSISDITAGQVDGAWVVASADISGEMIVWSESLEATAAASFPGDTVTSMQIFSSFVAAGFGSGMVRLYNAHDCSVAVEIAAHARWINAIDYNPNTGLLATASEDMLLCLWQMPTKANGGKVQLHSHELLKDCLLTGVRLEDSAAYVTAYDWDKLYVVPVRA